MIKFEVLLNAHQKCPKKWKMLKIECVMRKGFSWFYRFKRKKKRPEKITENVSLKRISLDVSFFHALIIAEKMKYNHSIEVCWQHQSYINLTFCALVVSCWALDIYIRNDVCVCVVGVAVAYYTIHIYFCFYFKCSATCYH